MTPGPGRLRDRWHQHGQGRGVTRPGPRSWRTQSGPGHLRKLTVSVVVWGVCWSACVPGEVRPPALVTAPSGRPARSAPPGRDTARTHSRVSTVRCHSCDAPDRGGLPGRAEPLCPDLQVMTLRSVRSSITTTTEQRSRTRPRCQADGNGGPLSSPAAAPGALLRVTPGRAGGHGDASPQMPLSPCTG